MLAVSREVSRNWIDPLKPALLQDGIFNPFPMDVRPKDKVYKVNDYADDGSRTWMNANVPFTVY